MDELTMTKKSKTTATLMQGGEAVGHLGLMAHNSMCFINMAHVHGISLAAHVSTLEDALNEARRVLARETARREEAA